MKKRIVVYYSFEGNTKKAAEKIAEGLQSDIWRLKPVKEMPCHGVRKFIFGGMQATFGCSVPIQKIELDMEQYDEIILGTPVWAGKCTPVVNQFLKEINDREKITAVFTCSGGGDNGQCIANLRKKRLSLKHTVALADCNNPLSKENDIKIMNFLEELKIDE